MNTAYNSTTTSNRYNDLLQAALKRINDRKRSKTEQEPEEVTTATPDEVTTTPTQQPEPVATPDEAPSKSRRQIIEEMRSEQDGYPVPYWNLLAREIGNKTGGQLWNVPKFGAVVVTDKNIPWYFRYFNDLKTKPARDIEAIKNDARNLLTQLEKRIEAGVSGLPYAIETCNMAEEYASLIIELHSTANRKYEGMSEVEMYDIIGKQITYATKKIDKYGHRFTSVTNMAIDFMNVTSIYNSIKSVYDANHTAPAPTPEPTGAPEQVPAPRKMVKNASPKALKSTIYRIFPKNNDGWTRFDRSVYHSPEGYAILTNNQILILSKLDYKEEYTGKMIKADGTGDEIKEHHANCMGTALKIYQPQMRPYAITPTTIEEYLNSAIEVEREYGLGSEFAKLLMPDNFVFYIEIKELKRVLRVSNKLATTTIYPHDTSILQLSGENGGIVVAGNRYCGYEYNLPNFLTIDLSGAMIPTGEDATPAPEVVTTAPEATAETPVQEPEDVTTEEVATTAPEVVTTAEDDATVFRKAIEECGNLGAKYLESLDYTQATEQVYSTKRGNSTKVAERYYTMKDGTKYGLYRRYNKNGKRAEFAVYQDERIIEKRTYGKNNNTFKAEVKYCGGKLCYQVEEGKVTSVEYYEGKRRHYHIEFDDNNRPATPRDLPAPAPTKTTKEAPATTKQEQPTSKQVPTPEATTAPEEVQKGTTSKQEDDTTPYWLLLDNELRAQQEEQEEQEQAPATPEESEELSKKLSDELATIISNRSNTAPEDEEIPDYNIIMGTEKWFEKMRATHDFEFEGCFSYNGRTYYSIVFCQEPVELKGRGVKRLNDYSYTLTERAFHKVCEEYTYFWDPNN